MQTKAKRTDNKLTVETRIQTVPEDESFLLDDADDQLDYETENDENNGKWYSAVGYFNISNRHRMCTQ